MSASVRRWVPLGLIAAVLAAGACTFDEAELVHPGSGPISAEVGQLRVLSYAVDPADDGWIDVLSPDPAVVEEAGEYREDDGARLADADEPGDRRRLFTAVGSGRTLLVEINCPACDGGVPATRPQDTEVHVWEFVAGPAGDRFTPSTGLATPDEPTIREVGQYVVIVREAGEPVSALTEDSSEDDAFPLRLVATTQAGDRSVAVYLASRPGTGALIDPADDLRYEVRVS